MVKKVFLILLLSSLFLQESYPQWMLAGLENEGINKVIIHPTDPNTLFAGSSTITPGSTGGFYKSTNAGADWDTLIVGEFVEDIVIDPQNDSIIYLIGAASLDVRGVIKTTNGGNTWFNADSGIILNFFNYYSVLRMDPQDSKTLYCGTDGMDGGNLFKTTNGGMSWFIPSADSSYFKVGVSVIEFDRYDTETLYVGRYFDGKLARSSNGGINWEYTALNNCGGIEALEFGKNSDEMYVAATWSIPYPVGIFKTTDRGSTWIYLGENFEGNVYDVKVDLNTREKVYMGLDAGYEQSGMYVKKNDESWESFGLSGLIINSIAITNNSIYAGTVEGLYSRDLPTSIDDEFYNLDENTYVLFPAYPNPFNPSTKIRFTVPMVVDANFASTTIVILRVYDVLGNEIATLISGEKPAGNYEVEFDAEKYNLPSGIYFYQLKGGDQIKMNKMLLLK